MRIEYLASLQNPDGDFGRFHSMSGNSTLTTEKALRRFWFLGLDDYNPTVKRCLEYVKKCLYKELVIPDNREKVIDWDLFEELMFSTWLSLFNIEDEIVTTVKFKWKKLIENSVVDNMFDYNEYKKQFISMFGKKGKREITPSTFYVVCLLKDMLSTEAKSAFFKYLMENGVYYILDKNLNELPETFDSKVTISYLIAIKLVTPFAGKDDLNFVKMWLDRNRNSNGTWDMPKLKPDGIVFPMSDSWRKPEDKLTDINKFINGIICLI